MINMVNANIPSPFKWNELHALTQECKYSRASEEPIERDLLNRHPFLKQATNSKGLPF